MRSFLVVGLLLFISYNALSQDSLPEEARTFIPAGYEPLDFITGDLNGDKRIDALLVVKQLGEDSLYDQESKRPLFLLIRQPDGKLKQVARNDNAIMCRHCGGVFGDPYEGIILKSRGFEITFYGGSSWRWGYTFTFEYRAVSKNWFLVKEKQVSFQSGDPEATMKEITIPATELGNITFEKFNSAPPYENSQWKVSALKTFFYHEPLVGSKPRKGYLLKGNIVTGTRHLKNFIEVSYESSKGEITNGFILRKDVQLIK